MYSETSLFAHPLVALFLSKEKCDKEIVRLKASGYSESGLEWLLTLWRFVEMSQFQTEPLVAKYLAEQQGEYRHIAAYVHDDVHFKQVETELARYIELLGDFEPSDCWGQKSFFEVKKCLIHAVKRRNVLSLSVPVKLLGKRIVESGGGAWFDIGDTISESERSSLGIPYWAVLPEDRIFVYRVLDKEGLVGIPSVAVYCSGQLSDGSWRAHSTFEEGYSKPSARYHQALIDLVKAGYIGAFEEPDKHDEPQFFSISDLSASMRKQMLDAGVNPLILGINTDELLDTEKLSRYFNYLNDLTGINQSSNLPSEYRVESWVIVKHIELLELLKLVNLNNFAESWHKARRSVNKKYMRQCKLACVEALEKTVSAQFLGVGIHYSPEIDKCIVLIKQNELMAMDSSLRDSISKLRGAEGAREALAATMDSVFLKICDSLCNYSAANDSPQLRAPSLFSQEVFTRLVGRMQRRGNRKPSKS